MVFDFIAPLAVLGGILFFSKRYDIRPVGVSIPILATAFFLAAFSLATLGSSDIYGHVLKSLKMLSAFSVMIGLGYVVAAKEIVPVTAALNLLLFSGVVSSFVCILQGKFGLLLNIVPHLEGDIQVWQRLTGLGEHPIEAGVISVYAIFIGMGLVSMTGRKSYLFLAAIGACSLMYSASMTAVLGLVVGTCLFLLIRKKIIYLAMVVFSIALVVSVGVSTNLLGERLSSRLNDLLSQGENYETIQMREDQWEKSLELIDLKALLVGHGYAPYNVTLGGEIHNGLLAALYHFGALGAISQLLFVTFFVRSWFRGKDRSLKATLAACMVVFMASYLSGPALHRRSLWLPMLLLSMITATSVDKSSEKEGR